MDENDRDSNGGINIRTFYYNGGEYDKFETREFRRPWDSLKFK